MDNLHLTEAELAAALAMSQKYGPHAVDACAAIVRLHSQADFHSAKAEKLRTQARLMKEWLDSIQLHFSERSEQLRPSLDSPISTTSNSTLGAGDAHLAVNRPSNSRHNHIPGSRSAMESSQPKIQTKKKTFFGWARKRNTEPTAQQCVQPPIMPLLTYQDFIMHQQQRRIMQMNIGADYTHPDLRSDSLRIKTAEQSTTLSTEAQKFTPPIEPEDYRPPH